MELLIEILSKHLKVLRQTTNMTQEELAKRTGVSRQTILGIEKGTISPSVTVSMALIAVFTLMTSPMLAILMNATGISKLLKDINKN